MAIAPKRIISRKRTPITLSAIISGIDIPVLSLTAAAVDTTDARMPVGSGSDTVVGSAALPEPSVV